MIYVTHDQSEAMTLSDRIVVFRDGKIEQEGAPIEIYDGPRTKFVAEFIGDSNILPVDGFDPRTKRAIVPGLGAVRVERINEEHTSGARYLLLRPEEIHISSSGTDPDVNSGPFDLQTVVQYGSDSLLIGTIAGVKDPIRVRVSARSGRVVRTGQHITLEWPATSGCLI